MIDTKKLAEVDPEVAQLIRKETERKEFGLELIASENCVSEAVLEAQGSIMTDKYAEGYPGHRYYGGCEFYDVVENLAIDRAKKLFNLPAANVQPHSGANANLAVYMAFLKIGDTVLGPRLDHGGHLTHGSPANFSGKLYKAVGYSMHPETHLYQPDEVMALAKEHRPKMIICGATAYSRQIDWSMFRRAADEVGAFLMADISHYAGLIAGGAYKTPVGYVDLVTTTTHKTLRGPRGGMILGDEERMKQINKTVFPGLQGGPLMHQIAAKAVAFKEALQPEFKTYAHAIVANARALAAGLLARGYQLVSGGTDSHLMVLDLRNADFNGVEAETALGQVGITVNKNTVPNDPRPPKVTSGIRIGTAALTTRGFNAADMERVAEVIDSAFRFRGNDSELARVREKVVALCKERPLFPHRLKG